MKHIYLQPKINITDGFLTFDIVTSPGDSGSQQGNEGEQDVKKEDGDSSVKGFYNSIETDWN